MSILDAIQRINERGEKVEWPSQQKTQHFGDMTEDELLELHGLICEALADLDKVSTTKHCFRCGPIAGNADDISQ